MSRQSSTSPQHINPLSGDGSRITYDMSRRRELLNGMRAIRDPEKMDAFVLGAARSRPDFVDTPRGLFAAISLTDRELYQLLEAQELPYGVYLPWREYFREKGVIGQETEASSSSKEREGR